MSTIEISAVISKKIVKFSKLLSRPRTKLYFCPQCTSRLWCPGLQHCLEWYNRSLILWVQSCMTIQMTVIDESVTTDRDDIISLLLLVFCCSSRSVTPITETHHRRLSSAPFFAVSYPSHMLLISCSLFLPLVRFPVICRL